MLIGIDGNEANVGERVGSNVYAYKVLKGLREYRQENEFEVYLKSPRRKDLPPPVRGWQYRTFGPGKLWTQWRLPLDLYTHQPRPDIFFTPGHYAPRFSPVPSVVAIMDLAFLHFPDAFQPRVQQQLASWTKYSVKQASHILAISQSTKRDIIKHYGISSDKISVTYLGSNQDKVSISTPTQISTTVNKYGIRTPYFIFIGTRQPRKNLERLVKAFLKLQSTERDVSLVIVGKTWHQFTQADITSHPSIIQTGYVPDQDLPQLLQGSLGFVFPSLYEGFGLPVLEAMQQGIVVAASKTTSIPEITGDWPLLFDPYDTEKMYQALRVMFQLSPDNRKKLGREAKIRAAEFSWKKCVADTYRILNEVAVASKEE